jgi:hypothetical protein
VVAGPTPRAGNGLLDRHVLLHAAAFLGGVAAPSARHMLIHRVAGERFQSEVKRNAMPLNAQKS